MGSSRRRPASWLLGRLEGPAVWAQHALGQVVVDLVVILLIWGPHGFAWAG